MRVYTGTGDEGKTSLLSGERFSKDHVRLAASGTIDELNSMLGVVKAHLNPCASKEATACGDITRIQSDLFVIGAWFSTTPEAPERDQLTPFPEESFKWLEEAIDDMAADLPAFAHFILPGGHPSAAWSHVARTVCRRAERRAVALVRPEKGAPDAPLKPMLVYLNRLSDYLFVLARWCNVIHGVAETTWGPRL